VDRLDTPSISEQIGGGAGAYRGGVHLDGIYVRVPGAVTDVIGDGLDMTGVVPGRLHGWFPTVNGNWLGVVSFEIPYATASPRSSTSPNSSCPTTPCVGAGEADEPPAWKLLGLDSNP
jgi:hypothetical protein